MSVYSVFNIGTGHTYAEPNQTMGMLYDNCDGAAFTSKYVNDGPVGALGNMYGKGMDTKAKRTVDAILNAWPKTVNMTGHSRGAVLCHMIANDLAESKHPAAKAITSINMILLDPVNMTMWGDRAKKLSSKVPLKHYVSVVMENANTPIFPTASLKPLKATRDKIELIHMPGTHGSGTQPMTSAIGRACMGVIANRMTDWGSAFPMLDISSAGIANEFAAVRLENHVTYGSRGQMKTRQISNDASGQGKSSGVTHSAQNFTGMLSKVKALRGREQDIGKNNKAMAGAGKMEEGQDFRNSPYFLNLLHMQYFADAFPGIFGVFKGVNPRLIQSAVDREVQLIETSPRFSDLKDSLVQLGML